MYPTIHNPPPPNTLSNSLNINLKQSIFLIKNLNKVYSTLSVYSAATDQILNKFIDTYYTTLLSYSPDLNK